MRIPSISALLCAALATVPAHAQPSTGQPLRERAGTNIAYRVSLPARWETMEKDGMLGATNGTASITVAAMDLVAFKRLDVQLSDAEQRRLYDNMYASSDSLMLVTIDESGRRLEATGGFRCSPEVRELREMAGRRAGFLRSLCRRGSEDSLRFDTWLAVKDGVMYMLILMAKPKEHTEITPLFTRVRESLVLAAEPPVAPR